MTYVQYSEPYPESRGDRFGSTIGRPHPHRGQDTAPGGLPATAVADGVVAGIRYSSVLGNIVVLRHADGKYSGYCHLASVSVSMGQSIARGQGVGTIGATGTAAQGRHLHYTIGNDLWGCESGHVEDPLAWINAHSAPPAPTWSYWEPSGDLAKRVQRALAKKGRYSGAIDGIFGPATRKGVQLTIRGVGYDGPIDGLIAGTGCGLIQEYAKKYGSYTGPIDKQLGAASWTGFALGLERP